MKDTKGFVSLIFLVSITYYVINDWDRISYSFSYSTTVDDVHINERPISCDWGYSPLGIKGCHYEKLITTIAWERDKNGKALISRDEGKTWVEGLPDGNTKIPSKSVYVEWYKKSSP
jgi:hypothetical protein